MDQFFEETLLLSSLSFARLLSPSRRIDFIRVAEIKVFNEGDTFVLPLIDAPFVVIIQGTLRAKNIDAEFKRGDAFGYTCFLDVSNFGPLVASTDTKLAIIPRELCSILDDFPPTCVWIVEFMLTVWNATYHNSGPLAAFQRQLKLSWIEHFHAFSNFSARALELLVPCVRLERYAAGDLVNLPNSKKNSSFACSTIFILRGRARAIENDRSVIGKELQEGEQYPAFSAMKSSSGHFSTKLAQRQPQVIFRAETDVVLLTISMAEYAHQMYLEDLRVVLAAPSASRSSSETRRILPHLCFPLFLQRTSDESLELARKMKLRLAKNGQVIVTNEDSPRRCFIVLSGRLDVYRNSIKIASVFPGDMCGSIMWLTNTTRSDIELRAGEITELLTLHNGAIMSDPSEEEKVEENTITVIARETKVPVERRDDRHNQAILDVLLSIDYPSSLCSFRRLPATLQVCAMF